MTNNIEIGTRIKHLREDNKLTQEALTKIMGYESKQVIVKLEAGLGQITDKQIEYICALFMISKDMLLTGEEKDLKAFEVKETDTLIETEVITSFSMLDKYDHIVIVVLTSLATLTMFLKDNAKTISFIVVICLFAFYLTYYIIKSFNKKQNSSIILSVPRRLKVVYYTDFEPTLVKRFRKDKLILEIVSLILTLLLYGLLVIYLKDINIAYMIGLIVVASFLVIYKIYNIVISFMNNLKGNNLVVNRLFILETIVIITSVLLMSLTRVLSNEVMLFMGFVIYINYLIIAINNFYLSKFDYKIE